MISEDNDNYLEAKSKIEAFCAYQERCLLEIKTKLQVYDLSKEDEIRLLSHLQEYSYWDEQRYADSYVNGKFRIKNWGRQKIHQALLRKKVASEIIEKALSTIPENANLETIKRLAQRKSDSLSNEKNDWTKRQKVLRFLLSKGFSYGDIAKVLGGDLED